MRFTDFITELWPAAFQPGVPMPRTVADLADFVERRWEDGGARLLISAHEGAGKSAVMSVFWPLWMWGELRLSRCRIILVSQRDAHAELALRRIMDVLLDPGYRDRYPHMRVAQDRTPTHRGLHLKDGGGITAVRTGGSALGHRADLIIMDDAQAVEASTVQTELEIQFYEENLRLKMALGAGIMGVQTRKGNNDLFEHILDKGTFSYLHLGHGQRS